MSENVIGVFGLPLSIASNFLVNGKEYIVPMVVEEPSIVAGVSSAAKIIKNKIIKLSLNEETVIGILKSRKKS